MTQIEYEALGAGRLMLSVRSKVATLKGMDAALAMAAEVVYEGTRSWFDSEGEGSWPQLSSATLIRKRNKYVQNPHRMMYEFGNLYESVTSASGPYSIYIPMHDGIVIGAAGWTPLRALDEGTMDSGAGHNTAIPARPIFPPLDSAHGLAIMREIGYILMKGRRSAAAFGVNEAEFMGPQAAAAGSGFGAAINQSIGNQFRAIGGKSFF